MRMVTHALVDTQTPQTQLLFIKAAASHGYVAHVCGILEGCAQGARYMSFSKVPTDEGEA